MALARLFDNLPRDRKRIVRMRVVDAGDYEGDSVRLRCLSCGHDEGWVRLSDRGWTVTDAKRGIPCPKCSEARP